ncbi:MAG: lasso RiPP family leader peptide-containing protein [Novosphingobium meiothermophilum]
MGTQTPNTRTTTRRAYSRPTLVVFGSVRELTGAMTGMGADMMAMLV